MTKYQYFTRALYTFFNAEHGFTEKVSIKLYVESVKRSVALNDFGQQLHAAFNNPEFSWKDMWLFVVRCGTARSAFH